MVIVFFFFGNLDKEIFACMKSAAAGSTYSLLAHYVVQEKENNKGKVFHSQVGISEGIAKAKAKQFQRKWQRNCSFSTSLFRPFSFHVHSYYSATFAWLSWLSRISNEEVCERWLRSAPLRSVSTLPSALFPKVLGPKP